MKDLLKRTFGMVLAAAVLLWAGCSLETGDPAPGANPNAGQNGGNSGGTDTAITYYDGDFANKAELDVDSWTDESWTLIAGEYAASYFAFYREESQAVTAGGADAGRVTVHTAGTVNGLEAGSTTGAGKKLTVVTVSTGDLPFDGGDLSFTLDVAEDGKPPRSVAVALNVTPNLTGAAVFRHEADGSLTRLDTGVNACTGFVEAFEWVEDNAEADTEYTIRVEKDETDVPRLLVSLGSTAAKLVDNVTLRLRGTAAGGPKKLQSTDANTVINKGGFASYDDVFIQIGGAWSGFVGDLPKRTFILGENITVVGVPRTKTSITSSDNWVTLFQVLSNAALVMEKGSAITGFISPGNNVYSVVIQVRGANQAGSDFTKNGRVHIKGGAITGCEFLETRPLILFSLSYSSSQSGKRIPPGSLTIEGDNAVTFSGNTNNQVQASNNNVLVDNLAANLADRQVYPPLP